MQSASRVTARAFATALVLAGLGASLLPSPAGAAPPDPEPRPDAAVVPPINAFPVAAPYEASFSDDWHACRDGCRRKHKGNDIFAPEGSPIVAVEPGVIARVDNTDDSNGGLSIWLVGDSGVAYWYAHNSANYVTAGQRVGRGQLIGRVGHTGNARTTPSHIHFQINRCGELSSSEPCTVDPFGFISRWAPGEVGGGADAVGLYRRSQASTELRIEGGSALPAFRYGHAPEGSTLAVAGDWNGDGTDTVGIYRRLDAAFHLRDEAGKTAAPVRFGTPGDTDVVPLAGDWNGDGRDSVGLYRRADATFVVRDDAGRTLPGVGFGWPGASDVLPVVGDWNGDGRDSFGLYRPRDGVFRLRNEAGGDLPDVRFGTVGAAAVPVVGDWDGDGRDTVGVYQRDTTTFELSGPDLRRPARRAAVLETGEGPAADLLPLAGDWNGVDVVTLDDLDAIFGPFKDQAVVAELPALNEAMLRSGATTPARKAAFLATVHNESDFRADAVEASNPSTYRGRGFIQLTGDFNYRAAGADLGLDLEAEPDLAATPATSAQVAAWYWTVARDINHAADRFDMAAVNMAVGFRPSVREDTQRCGDFVRALKWFNGGELPSDVNCERSVTSQLLAWASILGSGAGGSSSGRQVSIEAPDTGLVAAPGTAVPRRSGDGTTLRPARPTTTTGTTSPPATTPPRPGSTTTTTGPPTTTTTQPPTTSTTTPTSSTTTTTVPCDPTTTTTSTSTTTTSTPCPTTTTTTAPSTSTSPPSSSSSTGSTGSSTSGP